MDAHANAFERQYYFMELVMTPILHRLSVKERFRQVFTDKENARLLGYFFHPNESWREKEKQIKLPIGSEFYMIELIKIASLVVKHSENLHELRDDLMKFYWKVLKHENMLVKQWGYFAISEFVMKTKVPKDKVVEIYEGLLSQFNGTENSESRLLLLKAMNNILKVLEAADAEAVEGGSKPKLVQILENTLNFEGRNMRNRIHLCEIIIRHERLLYKYKAHFLIKITNTIQRLATTYVASPVQRKISVYLSEVVLKWIERSRTENCAEEDKESEEIFRKLASKGDGEQSNNRNLLYLLIRIAFMVYL